MADTNVDRVIVFRDKGGGWSWRAKARNGEIVSTGESHTRVEDATRAARGVFGQEITMELQRGDER